MFLQIWVYIIYYVFKEGFFFVLSKEGLNSDGQQFHQYQQDDQQPLTLSH